MNQWKIGDVTIKRVVEIESLGGSKVILPDATREVCKPFNRMRPHNLEDLGAAGYDRESIDNVEVPTCMVTM